MTLYTRHARSQKMFRGASEDHDDDAQIEVLRARFRATGLEWRYAPRGNLCNFWPFELNSDGFNGFFFTKSIIAKQFEGSRIKRMCIFHVLTVRGLHGREGASSARKPP